MTGSVYGWWAAQDLNLRPLACEAGGSAAAWHAGHRDSFDHDHVLPDLADRFDLVLDAIEATEGWVTNRLVPGKLILGELGDIEAGVRQMIRRQPARGRGVGAGVREGPAGTDGRGDAAGQGLPRRASQPDTRLPRRGGPRHPYGHRARRAVLASIDAYYQDQRGEGDGVATQLARQLADPARATRARRRNSIATSVSTPAGTIGARWPTRAGPWPTRCSKRRAGREPALSNLDVTPAAPVEAWPTEGVLAAVERGFLAGLAAHRGGGSARPVGTGGSASRAGPRDQRGVRDPPPPRACPGARPRGRRRRRTRGGGPPRASAAGRLGLSRAAFAESIGTSAPRLSTYLSGKVAPSSTLLVRMERVAGVIDTSPQPPTARR
jgi:hypothetical protein